MLPNTTIGSGSYDVDIFWGHYSVYHKRQGRWGRFLPDLVLDHFLNQKKQLEEPRYSETILLLIQVWYTVSYFCKKQGYPEWIVTKLDNSLRLFSLATFHLLAKLYFNDLKLLRNHLDAWL